MSSIEIHKTQNIPRFNVKIKEGCECDVVISNALPNCLIDDCNASKSDSIISCLVNNCYHDAFKINRHISFVNDKLFSILGTTILLNGDIKCIICSDATKTIHFTEEQVYNYFNGDRCSYLPCSCGICMYIIGTLSSRDKYGINREKIHVEQQLSKNNKYIFTRTDNKIYCNFTSGEVELYYTDNYCSYVPAKAGYLFPHNNTKVIVPAGTTMWILRSKYSHIIPHRKWILEADTEFELY
jgi:hypothetical protein